MKIQFYNSLTNQTEEFKSLEPGKVRMYSCGPTVYDFAHIGNFRSFLFGDLLRRFLELAGYDVHHVMNITDVGHMVEGEQDKMALAAGRVLENKKANRLPEGAIGDPNDPYQIADYYTNAFLEDGQRLGYKVAYEPHNVPKATDHVEGAAGMIDMIQKLIDRGHAYVADDGVVYYSVESFPDYGRLSGNSLEKIQSNAGGRVSAKNQAQKKHPGDFMLWKPDQNHIMKWDSPWGVGYPGWHIECSVMARAILGADMIDIHTGGEDLIFPHHECEIAQTCGVTGESDFAKFWIHARFLFVEGEKMSKSLGNFYTARDVFEGKIKHVDEETGDKVELGKAIHPAVLRLVLTKTHYRKKLNFTADGIKEASLTIARMVEFRKNLEEQANGETVEVDLSHPVLGAFAEALADDLNVSGALAVMLPWMKGEHPNPQESLAVFKAMNSVLAVAPVNEGIEGGVEEVESDSEVAESQRVQQLANEMDEARSNKDWAASDALRDQIFAAGYEVQQTPVGSQVKKKL
ncbi:MAG: cysteinyl-tRNA synthetase [Mariniblastus sp.]|jgi:cysteinyl-tRNA synthetase